MSPKKRAHRASPSRGRLIAVDGTRGADVRKCARGLARKLGPRKAPVGISWWDASGVFLEMGLAKRKHQTTSARTIILLYASDLLFRLRWEIKPALAEGRTVIAAPYVGIALAFGRANGLPLDWLTSLFRFAPRPDDHHFAPEHKKSGGWKRDGREGFAEFASLVSAETARSFDPTKARRRMIAALEAQKQSPERGRVSPTG